MQGGETFKKAIVVGAGLRWKEDLEEAKKVTGFSDADIVAVNGTGTLIQEPIAMWCSIHGDYLPPWMRQREAQGLEVPYGHVYGNFVFNVLIPEGVHNWAKSNGGGSSGLFAVKIAIELEGYNRIIVAGMPLEGRERVAYQEGEEGPTRSEPSEAGYRVYSQAWTLPCHLPMLKEYVRSVSGGFTQELLGRPTSGWAMGYDHTVQNM